MSENKVLDIEQKSDEKNFERMLKMAKKPFKMIDENKKRKKTV